MAELKQWLYIVKKKVACSVIFFHRSSGCGRKLRLSCCSVHLSIRNQKTGKSASAPPPIKYIFKSTSQNGLFIRIWMKRALPPPCDNSWLTGWSEYSVIILAYTQQRVPTVCTWDFSRLCKLFPLSGEDFRLSVNVPVVCRRRCCIS